MRTKIRRVFTDIETIYRIGTTIQVGLVILTFESFDFLQASTSKYKIEKS